MESDRTIGGPSRYQWIDDCLRLETNGAGGTLNRLRGPGAPAILVLGDRRSPRVQLRPLPCRLHPTCFQPMRFALVFPSFPTPARLLSCVLARTPNGRHP
jgi:hypothetical protein